MPQHELCHNRNTQAKRTSPFYLCGTVCLKCDRFRSRQLYKGFASNDSKNLTASTQFSFCEAQEPVLYVSELLLCAGIISPPLNAVVEGHFQPLSPVIVPALARGEFWRPWQPAEPRGNISSSDPLCIGAGAAGMHPVHRRESLCRFHASRVLKGSPITRDLLNLFSRATASSAVESWIAPPQFHHPGQACCHRCLSH